MAVNALERRTRQFEHYLGLMEHRAIDVTAFSKDGEEWEEDFSMG